MKAITLFVVGCIALNAQAASILFEDFEPGNVAVGPLDGQNGWSVLNGSVDVQSAVVHTSGTQAVEMADVSTITHSLTNNGNTLWIRFQARVSALPSSNPSTPFPNTSVAFYVNTNGNIVVYNGTTPVTTSTTMPINSWTQFDVYCDYDDANPNNWWWSLSMNGTYVGDMYVYSTNSILESIQLDSGSVTYIDQIDITDHEQAAGAPDFDMDGIPDWWELKYFWNKDAVTASAPSPTLGLTYLQTYIAGVSPLVSDPFLMQQTAFNALHWTSLPDRLYDVEWTSSLASNFVTIASNLAWPTETYTDNAHPTEAAGFYRLKARM